MKEKFINLYMSIAELTSKLSHAVRLQVGAVIVKDNRIISIGYNGMPAGWDNNCESKEICLSKDLNGNYFAGAKEEYPLVEYSDEDNSPIFRYRLKTKPEVLHAELNAIGKLAKSHESGEDADLFCTHAPCIECAKLIHASGIKRVFYRNQYRSTEGLDFLAKSNVEVIHRAE
jgi:dCMP deaminase